MQDLSALQLLDADDRPTFVLTKSDDGDTPTICYYNKAFRQKYDDHYFMVDSSPDVSQFRDWAFDATISGDCTSYGCSWHAFDVVLDSKNGFRVISSNPSSPFDASTVIEKPRPSFLLDSMRETSVPIDSDLEGYLRRLDQIDWRRSGLGTMSQWPQELLALIRLIMMMPKPCGLFVGSEAILIYNIPYARECAGPRHESIIGIPAAEAFPEMATQFQSSVDAITAKGYLRWEAPAAYSPTEGSGKLPTEDYATWIMCKVPDCAAIYFEASMVTLEVLNKRRGETLQRLRKDCRHSTSYASLCGVVASTVKQNPDVPFIAMYSVHGARPGHQEEAQIHHLQAIVPDQDGNNPIFDLAGRGRDDPITKAAQRAIDTGETIKLIAEDFSLPEEWQKISTERCQAALVYCLRSRFSRNEPIGVAIIGLNPRRPLDESHQAFLDSFIDELSSYAASAVMKEEEAHFRQAAAEQSMMKSLQIESFTRMLEMSDVGYFDYTVDGTLLNANNAWFNLSSHPPDPEARKSLSFMDVVYPEDYDMALGVWNMLVTEKQPITFEMRWKYPPTKILDEAQKKFGGQWTVASCIPIFNDQGELHRITGCMYDIEPHKKESLLALERAQMLERITASEEQFRIFAESASIGIYIFDIDRKLSYCNSYYFKITGHPEVPVHEFSWEGFIADDDLGSVESAWWQILETRQPVTHQFRLKRTWKSVEGFESQAWVSASSYPRLNEKNEVIAVQGALFDVSSLKWAETVQKVRVENALEAKRQQEQFIDMTSHELRNPISAVVQSADATIDSLKEITSLSQAIYRGVDGQTLTSFVKLTEEVASSLEAMQTIISCSGHSKRIIDDILTLSKLDAKLLGIDPRPARALGTIQNCIRMFSSAAESAGIDLRLIADTSLEDLKIDYLQLDSNRVDQVLINLLTNAIKFTQKEDQREITVTVGASSERPDKVGDVEFTHETISNKAELRDGQKVYLWISVKDTGAGLSGQQQSLLFHRFSQAFAPRTHSQYGGSGLGLFISRSLSELQGGEISVFSNGPGTGSTFAFYITTYTAAPPKINSPNLDNDPRVSSRAASPGIRRTILVVEDNIVNQKVLMKQIKKHGYEVYVADNGLEALDFLKKTKHWRNNENGLELSLILMDAEMPVMGGLEAARAIRRLEREGEISAHIPIIAVSANARPEQMNEMLMSGMDDAIAKPFRIPDLLPKVERLAI